MIDSQYEIGQTASLTFAEQDGDGNPLLPTALSLTIIDPTNEKTTYNYPSDIALLPDGTYSTPFDLATFEYIFDTTNKRPGRWGYEWRSTGFGQSVMSKTIYLRRSKFSSLRPLQLSANIQSIDSIISQPTIA